MKIIGIGNYVVDENEAYKADIATDIGKITGRENFEIVLCFDFPSARFFELHVVDRESEAVVDTYIIEVEPEEFEMLTF